MTEDQRRERHSARMERLFNRHPGRFCWMDMALFAVCGPRNRGPQALHYAEDRAPDCIESASRDGMCYCGAFGRQELGATWNPADSLGQILRDAGCARNAQGEGDPL